MVFAGDDCRKRKSNGSWPARTYPYPHGSLRSPRSRWFREGNRRSREAHQRQGPRAGVGSSMSTPTEASVTIASVRSGMISDTAPTKVVFPTPNPPAMTIFVEAWPRSEYASECFKATHSPSYELVALITGRTFGQRSMYVKVTGKNQITDQDARDAQWQIHQGRDFGHRRTFDA